MISEKDEKAIEDKLSSRWSENAVSRSLAIGLGWFPLVAQLDDELAELAPNYKLIQVKQKFGDLRVYYTTNSDDEAVNKKARKIVSSFEIKSSIICENCGLQGLSHKGYMSILCDKCATSRWRK